MNKGDKTRVLYVATFAWTEWNHFSAMAGGNHWTHQDKRQAFHDTLQAMQVAGLIDKFSLHKGVLVDGVWHTKTPELSN